MKIEGNREYSCNLKFKEQSFLDRSPRHVRKRKTYGHIIL